MTLLLLTRNSVVSAGIVRTFYLVRVESSDIDKTWNGFNVFVAGIAELNLGIICACAPSVQHFLRTSFRNLTSKLTGSGSSQSGMSSSRSGDRSQTSARGGRTQRSEMSRVQADDVERWAADSRKYRTAAPQTGYKKPVISSATSGAPHGSSPLNAHPGAVYIHDDDSGLEEDWTNSSRLVV
jgi:hypothetical protein